MAIPPYKISPRSHQRREDLHKIMDSIDNNQAKLTDFGEFEIKMDKLEKTLEDKYAN